MMVMDSTNERRSGRRRDTGSALILTVVLTSLLAIVGVLFLMAARIDKMATSATADNRQLGFAVDSVIAQIDEVLAKDVPGNSPAQKYYDYPDKNNAWLADLEPYARESLPVSTPAKRVFDYYWRQVSDITGVFKNVLNVQAKTVGEREAIDPCLPIQSMIADADGDGVSDALWFAVPGLVSSKGKPIYAAVRIVDNAAMLNVNTGYKFDPTDPNRFNIDGHSQLQVNVAALAARPGDTLSTARGINAASASDLARYEREVIWQYDYPTFRYTPFDLSDELELRYRYLLDQNDINTRVENWGLFRPSTAISTPVDSDGIDLDRWYLRAAGVDPNVPIDPCVVPDKFKFDSRYALRHIATVHNLDRILTPTPIFAGHASDPGKMLNVNTASGEALSEVIAVAFAGVNLAAFGDPAQLAANITDYIDEDDEVTVLGGSGTTSWYYGFERPCIYLSELAYRFVLDTNTNLVHKSYAIELCRPYFEDSDPRQGDWRIVIDSNQASDVTQVITWSGTRQFHVLLSEDAAAPLKTDYLLFEDMNTPLDPALVPGYDPSKYTQPATQALDSAGFSAGAIIRLERRVLAGARQEWIPVDIEAVPATFASGAATAADGAIHKLQRDISPGKCIFRLWGPADANVAKSLGNGSSYYRSGNTDSRKLQAHPANAPLTNIGELGKIFAQSAYTLGAPRLLAPTEEDLLINLCEPLYQRLFNYLTVTAIDPVSHNPDLDPAEMRLKGRININTAPVFVLAQLPWMTQYQDAVPLERARAIVEYRNKHGAFTSIGGLMSVPQMWRLGSDGINNLFDVVPTAAVRRGPDLTPDAVTDDLEERDLIFTRISNLVTVRSDVFTAYILVRIGTNGPQKRVVAILDRSQVKSPGDSVRVLSLEQTPDPR